ncbi:unnamed protein product, partial [Prorocentrum cordatum]
RRPPPSPRAAASRPFGPPPRAAPPRTSPDVAAAAAASGSAAAAGEAAAERSSSRRPTEGVHVQETGNSRRIEEEAISKLERLGYPREEIVRQLKDESSHLCKLYHRFLKALTAWDKK